MTIIRSFLALAFTLALGLSVAAQAPAPAPTPKAPTVDITGVWKAKFDSPIGVQTYTYTFVVKGVVLTGKALSDMGESPITEGLIDGATVSFVEMFDGAIRVDYSGTITSADEIRFSRKVGDFGVEELVAYREKK